MNFGFRNNNVKVVTNAVRSAINNAARTLRDQMSSINFDENKDYYKVYGYPTLNGIGEDKYWKLAKRNAIAHFLTTGIAHDCWANGFEICVDGEPIPEANKLLKIMARNGLFRDMERADIMNRINRFSIAEVVVNDGMESNQPLGTANDIGMVRVIPYREGGVEIVQRELDPTSPRFNMPTMYQAQKISSGSDSNDTNLSTKNIHWSRVIVFNEGQMDSTFDGESALEDVYNNILNIDKAVGGAAEAYFRNASPKLTMTSKDNEFTSAYYDDPALQEKIDDKTKEFINDMKQFIIAGNFDVNAIHTPHASPIDTVKVNLWDISASKGVPIRILTGEGSGQLAGSEDKLTYGVTIDDRQSTECSFRAYRLLDILQACGLMKLPDDYEVTWPKEEPTTQMQEAELADKIASALEKISRATADATGLGNVFDPKDLVKEVTGLDITTIDEYMIGELDGDINDSDTNGSAADSADDTE